jgi:hypothetical protein
MGPRLVDRKKTSGIWVSVTQAALNATSSVKWEVEVGASTDSRSDTTITRYVINPSMRSKDRTVRLRLSIVGTGSSTMAQMCAATRLSVEGLLGDKEVNSFVRDLHIVSFDYLFTIDRTADLPSSPPFERCSAESDQHKSCYA